MGFWGDWHLSRVLQAVPMLLPNHLTRLCRNFNPVEKLLEARKRKRLCIKILQDRLEAFRFHPVYKRD
ncbi:hypothetical protein D3C80_1827790 [compost metagenome]